MANNDALLHVVDQDAVTRIIARVNSGDLAQDPIVQELRVSFVQDELQVATWDSHDKRHTFTGRAVLTGGAEALNG
jgi:hypothetical protein